MTPKEILTNPAFCVLPWTGFIMEADGNIKNCVASTSSLGNVNNDTIENILNDLPNRMHKTFMKEGIKIGACNTCYTQEQNEGRQDIISSRIYYRRELKSVPLTTYDSGFSLHHVDVRWSNACNLACVYCGPKNSSRWADEIGQVPQLSEDAKQHTKEYIFKHAHQLKNVYLAGGEPLLMKENLEFLELLLAVNPDVHLRINTNLSVVDTKIFNVICKFKNVHWIISVETMNKQFEYIRFGADWQIFLENLKLIKTFDHKISFNMLWFLLNSTEIFDTIDYFISVGFHPNSFVLGPITGPKYLDIRNLPNNKLELLKQQLETRLKNSTTDLVYHGYRLLLNHLAQPFDADFNNSLHQLSILDKRRNIDCQTMFPNLYA